MKTNRLFPKCILLISCIFLLSNQIFAQLSGTKTIPGSYSTISAAVTALNAAGVGSGGVTFNVAAGHTETITATISLTVSGTAANRIVFQKDPSTTGADPLITAYTGGVGTPSTATQDGIWRLLGASYVTINGIDLTDNPSNTTNPSTMEYGYALYKKSTSVGCQYDSIKNCTITLNRINNASGTAPMTDGSVGIIVMNATYNAATTNLVPVSAAGTNSNNIFYSNTIQNCNIGISLIGYAAPSPFTLADNNNDVGGSSSATGNTIINYGGATGATNPAAAVRTLAQYGLNLSYNTINSNNGSGVKHPNTLRGLYINTATSASTTITYNTITLQGGGTTFAVTGIENVSGATPASNTINISNNTITNSTYTTATTGSFYGIYNNASNPATLTISNNTVSGNSTSASTSGVFYGIYNTGAATGVNITGNTVSGNSSSSATGNLYGIYNTGIGTAVNITSNTVSGNINGTSTGLFSGIINSAATPSLTISNNTVSGNSTSTATGSYYAIYNSAAVTTSITMSSNNIGTGSSPAITFNAANSGAFIGLFNNAGAATTSLSITNNNIQGVTYSVASTGTNTYIDNTAATLSQAITGNTFTNLNLNTSGNIVFISDNVIVSASGTQNINSNSISGTFSKSLAGGTITLFNSNAASASGAVINNNNNNFSNITVTGATTIAGWVNTDAGTGTKNIQNNTFTNWTGGTNGITVLTANITSANNAISGNFISNINGAGAVVGITTAAGNNNIYSNTVDSLITSGAATATGISVTAGTNNSVYQNKIYGLQATNASGTVNGILVSGATVVTANIYNNIIGNLLAPSASGVDPIRGISVTATAANSTINVFYNTVYINATSSAVNFGTTGIYHTTSATATTAKLNLRNNIISNISTANGTGYTVAYRRSSTTLTNYASTSNNNLFYSGTPSATNLIYYDGTNAEQTLTLYKALVANRDSVSVTENICSKFLSTTGSSSSFLFPNPALPTQAESGAVNIAGITTDYNGNIRQGNPGYTGTGTAPDMGADEFNGIALGPLSGSYNVGTGQTYTNLTGANGFFAAVNSLGLSGNVTVNITSNLAEDGTNSLYKWTQTGAGNYYITIKPGASTPDTISGNILAGMIRLNNASRVIIDGSNGTTNNYLTFINTNTAGTTATAFTFINGATNDTIRYCNVQAYANATNGVILFSTSTVAGGNSSDAISNCNINATVSGNTGSVAIYSAGTVGKENTSNTISNNNISNYYYRAVDIAATGSNAWIISGNNLYNGSVSGSINYTAASTLHGIRVLGGSGYSVLNNYIGGSASSAGGSPAVYSSTSGNVSYQGILMQTTSASPASYIQGNTIANISLSSVPTAANSVTFIGIESDGSGVNIGGASTGNGNTIGSNSTNGSIVVTTTTGTNTFTSLIKGINCQSTGGSVIGNQAGGIDINNIGTAPAPSTFYGIYVNVASAPSQVNNNIIGSTGSGAAINSIRVLSTSTAVNTAVYGIQLSGAVTSTVQVNSNTIQNLSNLSASNTTGGIVGIYDAATGSASVTISSNSVTANLIASSTTGAFYGIYNSGAGSVFTVTGNTVSNNSNASAASTAVHYMIYNSGAVSSSITITGNTISGNSITGSTGLFSGIVNSGATPSLTISSNTISGSTTSSASGSYYAIYNVAAITTSNTISSNNIGTGSSPAITYNAANSGTFYAIFNTNGTAASTLSITNNNVQGISYSVAGTGSHTYISNTAATLSQAITGNAFTNLSVNTTGNITFISDNVIVGATGTQNINNNSISGTFSKTAAGGTITLFSSNASSVSGAVINNNNNNFSNITVTGATTIAGWINTDAGAGTKNIQSNIFTYWTGGSGAVTALQVNITGTSNTVTNNTINNLTGSNAITGILVGTGNNIVYSNTIDTLTSSGAASVMGISITGGTNNSVYKNKIYGLQSTNAGGTVYGISVSGATLAAVTVYNNLIGNLTAPAASGVDPIRGISVTATSTSSSINVYYNSIYLNATSSATNFGTTGIYHTTNATASTSTLNLRNNIIANTSTANGTGYTVVYRRSNTTLTNYASTSNNNLFYAGTPSAKMLIYYDGTNSEQTMASYLTLVANRDSLSVTENVVGKFLSTNGSSPSFLRLDSTQTTLALNGARNISGITTDYDGQIRAGNPGYTGTQVYPCIGADEIVSVDKTPPTILYTPFTDTTSVNNRTVGGIVITDASGVNITPGTNPRIYYKRISDANAWVDNTSATNGWKYTQATNSSSPFTFTINYSLLYSGGGSLTAGKIQYFIIAQDLAPTPNVGIDSGSFASTPSSVALTSAAFPISGTINAYQITCFAVTAGSNSPVCAGSSVSLTASAPLAVSPIVYTWTDPTSTVVSGSQNPTVTALSGNYKVVVSDATGCSDSATTTVALTTRPTAAISGSTNICNGSSATLSIAVTGNGIISGTLSNGDGFSGRGPVITINESPSTTTTFTVATLSDSLCTSQSGDLTGTAIVTVNSGLWTGAVSTDWGNPSNWCGGMPNSTVNATIPSGLTNYPVVAETDSVQNINIASGASLTISGADSLTITGTITNNGTLTDSGTIILNGTVSQSFPGSAATVTTINNLTINNPSGVSINKSFAITGTLTSIAGTMDLTSYNITLYSDSAGTAMVAPVSGAFAYSGGGNFIVQRYIPAHRSWYLLTAPLTRSNTIYNSWQNGGVYTPGEGTSVTGPGPSPANGLDSSTQNSTSMKTFNVATQSLVAVSNTYNNISEGTNGSADNTGYFIFIRGDRNPANFTIPNTNITTLSSAGQLQTGPQTFPASAAAGGYTLIGNPYASPIYFGNVTLNNLINRFYVWDPTLNTVGGYVLLDDAAYTGTYTSSVLGSAQGPDIQSSQAFLVQTLGTGSASLTVNESSKSTVDNTLVFRPASVPQSINLTLNLLNADNSTTLADGTLVQFDSTYSSSYNAMDALKMGNINESLGFVKQSHKLAFERRPLLNLNDTLVISLSNMTARNYQFVVTPGNWNQPGVTGFLVDNYLGTQTPISLTGKTVVNFVTDGTAPSLATKRFSIVFRPAGIVPVLFTSIKAIQQNSNVNVSWNLASQLNVKQFIVERSADGSNFTNVATISATANTGYNWVDMAPFAGNNYYRIMSISADGTIQNSQVVKVYIGVGESGINVYPNPVTNNMVGLQLNNLPAGNYHARILNTEGKELQINLINHTGGSETETIQLNKNIAKGSYYLELVSPDNSTTGINVLIN